MADQSSDTIDFKPFFDMVVGILFILLILIAAQLFFTRFETDSPEAQAQQKRATRLIEQELFLNSVADTLKKSGFVPTVDRVGNRVSIPLSSVTGPQKNTGAQWPLPNPEKITAFAQGLTRTMSCAALNQTAFCAKRFDVNFASAAFELTLGGGAAGATPNPQAQILAMQMGAALFGAAPEALAWYGYQGTALFPSVVKVTSATVLPEASALAVEFTFAP
jgi:hypothetical protein